MMNVTPDSVARQRLKKLKSGCVLVANETLKDPNFDATMVLICVHNRDGAYVLVLNRPSHMPISEMFDGFGGIDRKRKIYIGGPVRQEELQILQITDEPAPNSYQVGPRIHMGGQWEDLRRVLENDNDSSRLFLGYSGWAPDQLEFEIIADAWEVYNVDLERLLGGAEDVWTAGVQTLDEYLRSIAV